MNRRTYLALAGTAPLVAGCGFAHHGGALRDEVSVPSPDSPAMFDPVGDRFAIGRSESRFVEYEDETTFATVTVVSLVARDGVTTARADIDGGSQAVAADDHFVYALQEDRVVAVVPDAERSPAAIPAPDEAEVVWTAAVEDVRGPIGAVDGTLAVRRETDIVGIADGAIEWELSLEEAPQSIHGDEAGPLVTVPDTVVAFETTGEERWTIPTAGVAAIDPHDGVVAIRDDAALRLVDADAGDELWATEIAPLDGHPRIGTERVAVPTRNGIECYDRASGDRDWRISDGHRPRPVLVVGDRTIYSATANGTVLAAENGEVTWRWTDSGAGDPLVGWIDGDRVAVLDDAGTIRRFQRREEETPLLF